MFDDQLVQAKLALHVGEEFDFTAVVGRELSEFCLLARLVDDLRDTALIGRHLGDQRRVDSLLRDAEH